MRADDRGHAVLGGFKNIVTAELDQAPADKGYVGN